MSGADREQPPQKEQPTITIQIGPQGDRLRVTKATVQRVVDNSLQRRDNEQELFLNPDMRQFLANCPFSLVIP